jgi:hypothetical protein
MTLEALFLVASGIGFRVAVWVVACQAAQFASAFGVATAPRQSQGLEAKPERVRPGQIEVLGLMDAVTLGAHLIDRVGRCFGRAIDCGLREFCCDSRKVVSTRPMTSLTADRSVLRFRACFVENRVCIRRVTRNAPPHSVTCEHLLAQVFFLIGWLRRQPRGDVPARAFRGSIKRHPNHERSVLIVPPDEGCEVIERAECVIDDCA